MKLFRFIKNISGRKIKRGLQCYVLIGEIKDFINELKALPLEAFTQPVRDLGVTYGDCIERSLEEMADELRQIRGLLEEREEIGGEDEVGESESDKADNRAG